MTNSGSNNVTLIDAAVLNSGCGGDTDLFGNGSCGDERVALDEPVDSGL